MSSELFLGLLENALAQAIADVILCGDW